VVYEQGGLGHHVVFEMFAQSAVPVLRATGFAGKHDDRKGWQLNLSQLSSALENGDLGWVSAEARQY
jgi:hypothetical protein